MPSEGLTRNVLACPPPAPLCPMLRELGLAGITGNATRIPGEWLPTMLDMLLGENLDTFYLTVDQLNAPLSVPPSRIVNACPHLQTLGLHFLSAADGQLGTLFDAFLSHTYLSTIDLLACDIPVQVPESLSRLPHLKKLSMMDLSAICNHSTPNYSPDSFPALTSLVLGGSGMHPTTLHTMMGAWSTRRPLQSVVLQTTNSRTDMQGWKLQHTTECIQQHCDHASLRKIIIHSPEPSGADLDRHDISAMSPFRNLATLRINLIDGRCALTDDDVAAMASWWPLIEELCIMPDKTSDLGILPTLSSLSSLARGCSRLHTLELPFSAQLIPPVVASQQSLTKMSIMWYAPIEDSDGVLQFLRSTFPKLRSMRFGGYSGRIMYLDGTFPRSRAWESVWHSEEADLCRIARVSKDWLNCANPLIWERIPDIGHLLALLPAASLPKKVRRGSKTLTLSRPLEQDDWAPVSRLARFVRYVPQVMNGAYRIVLDDGVAASVVACPPAAPLCPSMRELTVNARYFAEADELRCILGMFLARGTVSLSLFGRPYSALHADPQQIIGTSPHLRTLKLQFFEAGDGRVAAFIDALHAHQSLTNLDLMLSEDLVQVLDSLARMPRLWTLKLMRYHDSEGYPTHISLPSGAFPCLRSFTLYGGIYLTTLHTMMNAWGVKPLLTLRLNKIRRPPGMALLATTERIQRHCEHASLVHLKIHCTLGTENTRLQLSFGDLFPLSSFRQLATLEIELDEDGNSLTDDDVIAMASWWPFLEVLQICLHHTRDDGPLPTLASLSALARACPHLHKLELPINASLVPPVASSQQSLVELRFMWYAPIGNQDEVVQFLHSTFPNLRELIPDYGVYHGRQILDDTATPTGDAWERVANRLAELTA
ncbi:uncharacterized protein SCHCODRAFT_02665824 [Schizophyllum commune H4-8]|nr:uncharacterized protein SCHCODRAFT_02665824 [Schizophyllum commune H4-8]KAI5895490.1 hypothetical protein SCHCODRAFT_02665824 [Schizophyllum commune H4-8]